MRGGAPRAHPLPFPPPRPLPPPLARPPPPRARHRRSGRGQHGGAAAAQEARPGTRDSPSSPSLPPSARWFPLSELRAAFLAAFPPDAVARLRLRAARGAGGKRPNLGAPGAPQAGAGARAGGFCSEFSSRFIKAVKTERRSLSRSVWGLRGGRRGPPAHQRRPRFIPLGSAPAQVLRLSMTKKMTFRAIPWF